VNKLIHFNYSNCTTATKQYVHKYVTLFLNVSTYIGYLHRGD